MRALSVPELLGAWESGLTQGPVERVLTLLGAACPELPRDSLALLSIGQRDARLLTLREWTFGSRVDSLVPCPRCGERLELTFNVADVRVDGEAPPELPVAVAEYVLRLRPPNSTDIAALAAEPSVERKRRLLFERCLIEAHRDGQDAPPETLPAEALDTAARHMAEADPQADIQLDIACSHCGERWRSVFDIAAFFWIEIEAWACRILREVHTLASAYGWSERDILALTPARRQAYLEMAGA
jgi:hypothetical protein